MNIKIKNTSGKGFVLINWNRVDFVTETRSVHGDEYCEIHIGKQRLGTSDTLDEIQAKANGVSRISSKEVYDELGA